MFITFSSKNSRNSMHRIRHINQLRFDECFGSTRKTSSMLIISQVMIDFSINYLFIYLFAYANVNAHKTYLSLSLRRNWEDCGCTVQVSGEKNSLIILTLFICLRIIAHKTDVWTNCSTELNIHCKLKSNIHCTCSAMNPDTS